MSRRDEVLRKGMAYLQEHEEICAQRAENDRMLKLILEKCEGVDRVRREQAWRDCGREALMDGLTAVSKESDYGHPVRPPTVESAVAAANELKNGEKLDFLMKGALSIPVRLDQIGPDGLKK